MCIRDSVLTDTGKLFGFGDNKFGQILPLSDNCCDKFLGPVQIPTPESFAYLRAGWTHALGVSTGGRVYNWGRNNYGQLGRKTGQTCGVPIGTLPDLGASQVESGSEHCLAISEETGELVSWGWNEHGNCGDGTTQNVLTPVLLDLSRNIDDGYASKIVKIKTSSAHNFALLTLDKHGSHS